MSERDGFPAGVPCWVDTWQDDFAAAKRFYDGIFGWEVEDPGDNGYAICRLRGRDVAAIGTPIPPGAPPTAVWSTYVKVDDVDAVAGKAPEAGGGVHGEPFDSLDGARLALVVDPGGGVIGIWQQGQHQGAQLVNEPGAWSMSSCHTRDPEACKPFYSALFGWETESFGMGGDAEIELFRLPGFVGGEPSQPVPRDVVAVMIEMDSHGFPAEVPAHWGVDFWIDDVDAAVAKAPDLGGRVILEPSDNPAFRVAALLDPGGASLTISQLKLQA
jgi:uncharacterized protein